jgi:hypothetical protein
MEVYSYKNKYLKYKQKYTNALENMYGGNVILNELLNDAFNIQPEAVYIVDEKTYDYVRTLLSLGIDETTKTINKYTNCIDMLIGISNKNVLKIIPMTEIIVFENDNYPNHPWNGYKKGLQKIDGSNAAYIVGTKPNFTTNNHNRTLSYFGMNPKTMNYDSAIVKQDLLNAKKYFEACSLSNPFIIVLNGNELHFHGVLYSL